MSKAVERLVRSFKPEHYKLSLNVDISSKRYSGKVVIKGVKVGRPSSRITLHQKDLKVKKYSLVRHHKGEDTSVELARHNAHDGYDELR